MTRKRLLICGIAVALLACCLPAAAQKTYAERLGWKPDDRVVIFHCDDAGMSHSSNRGAIEALEGGILTSVSTMMPCGWVPEFAAYLLEHPEVDNGLHLTLTSEWKKYRWPPLAGRDAVPGLIDSEGCMWHSVAQVVAHASADEVDKEMRAQLARAKAMGIPITHLDTHMGTVYANEQYLERYIRLGIENQIPIMIPGGHLTYVSQQYAGTADRILAAGIPEMVWQAGLPVLDDLAGGIRSERGKDMVDNAIQMLRDLKPGITQIIVHCTRPTDEFSEISSSGPKRLEELELMLNPRIKKCIEKEGIILTTWRELKERRDKVGATE